MYHFSLKSYIEEFENSVKCSTHNQNLTERLTAINELHTVNFYKTTNQALFVRDRLPFAFLLCIRLLEISDQNIISLDLLNFLAQTLTIKLCDASETLNPSFVRLPDYVWDNVTKLERSSTKYHGLKESLIEFTKEWYTWFSSSQESPLIGKFGSLDVLSQLVISTCLRPDRLAINVRRFITKHSRHQLNEAVSSELVSSFKNRLVLLLPGRDVDLTSGLEQLAQITSTVQLVTPGQGQQKHIETVLHEAAKTGECVILIDCHLSLKWLHKFENIFETWSHSIVHNTFRCWISSETYHKFPIEIAQQAKKISVDKPEDLRLTIKRLSSDTSKDIKLNQNLILQIATLHAIFLHRLQFVSLGWNCNYDFSDNDFMTCCNLLSRASLNKSSSNYNSSDILMAVNLAYNCRVSDIWDQRLLAAITREVLTARTHPHSESRTIMILETNEENAITTGNHQQSTIDLPTSVNPENYGLNRLASASVYLAESLNVQRALKLLFVSTPIDLTITAESIEMVLYTCRLILEILPEETNVKKFKRSLVIQRPMELMLLTEIENYNKLLYNIKKDIAEFRSAMKGFIEWSLYFNELFYNIASNIVPAQWGKFNHQDEKNTKNLLSWSQILSKKITKLQEWSVQLEPPEPINLAILQRPLAFLSALMQMNVAHMTDLDDMNWIFTIDSSSTLNADEIPSTLKDGCILSGLRLEGAAWNKEKACLSEAKTSCIMPNIIIKPTRKSAHSKPQDTYICPCFANDARSQYLFSVPLNPGENSPNHWVIRSVVLILNLE